MVGKKKKKRKKKIKDKTKKEKRYEKLSTIYLLYTYNL